MNSWKIRSDASNETRDWSEQITTVVENSGCVLVAGQVLIITIAPGFRSQTIGIRGSERSDAAPPNTAVGEPRAKQDGGSDVEFPLNCSLHSSTLVWSIRLTSGFTCVGRSTLMAFANTLA